MKWLGVVEFSTKYGMTTNNVRGFVNRGTIPEFVYKYEYELENGSRTLYLMESYFIKNNIVLDTIRTIIKRNFILLRKHLKPSILAKFISIISNGFFTINSARDFANDQIFDFREVSLLSCYIKDRTKQYLLASEKLVSICKFIGSFDETDILDYLSDEFDISAVDIIPVKIATFKVSCGLCGDIRYLKNKNRTPGSLCHKCKNLNAKLKYYYFCPYCPSVRASRVSNRKTSMCIDCSKKKEDKNRDDYEFCFEEMRIIKVRYFAICTDCESEVATREVVNKQDSGYKKCRKHKVSKPRKYPIGSKRKSTYVKKDKKPKTYEQVGTDGAIENKVTVSFAKQKLQVVDLDTMEAPVKKRKEKEIPKSTPEQEADMMAEFFKNGGKVTRC